MQVGQLAFGILLELRCFRHASYFECRYSGGGVGGGEVGTRAAPRVMKQGTLAGEYSTRERSDMLF